MKPAPTRIENKGVSILTKYNVRTIGICGSYTRSVQRPDSNSFINNLTNLAKSRHYGFVDAEPDFITSTYLTAIILSTGK